MLKFTRLVASCFLAVVLHSCCTEMYCVGIEDMDRIEFENFTASELDTVILYSFSDQNHTILLDSSLLNVQISGNVYSANLYPYLDQNASYSFKLSNQTTYQIGNFEGKKTKCNSGFMCRDSYMNLESYTINGVRVSGPILKITK